MKNKFILFSIFLLGITLNLGAAKAPLAVLTIENYSSFISGATTLVNAGSPGMGIIIDPQLRLMIGSPKMHGIDLDKPWHAAVWMKNMGAPPIVAVYIPVNDFELFKSGLSSMSPIKIDNPLITTLSSGQHAIAIIKSKPSIKISQKQRDQIIEYSDKLTLTPEHLLSLKLQLSDKFRKQLLATMAPMKKMFVSSMTSTLKSNPQAFNITGFTEIFEMYFNIAEILVKGMDKYAVHLDVSPIYLSLYDELKAIPDTDLASFIVPHSGGIGNVLSGPNTGAVRELHPALHHGHAVPTPRHRAGQRHCCKRERLDAVMKKGRW